MSALLDLVRPDLSGFGGYSSARKEASGGRVFLNANESPWAPEIAGGEGLNRYPEPQPEALVQALASLYGVSADELLVGRGSDEPIDLLVRALCRAGEDAVLICPPTFGMYAVAARVQNARLVEVSLAATGDAARPFALDADAVIASALSNPVKLVFLCSPNNPTGQALPVETIERIASALEGRAVVVVDEAYGEFMQQASATSLRQRFPQLAVLRTLSKAHALAGARIGSLIAAPELIRVLRAIMAPYPISAPCARAALAALQPEVLAKTQVHVAELIAGREALAARLAATPGVLGVYPSDANFLVVRCTDPAAIYRRALASGVVLRDVSRYPLLGDCLRVSIGTPEENAAALAVFANATQEAAA
ncbi:histidinol-phosphate transaminase [Aquimonas voraii]|uniref:Histidinol-phosphate aminotransferase n=1 Tax=Aquimonas voraii TaxID=265719 RepID=A0A1G6SWB4_9GAMM|nr:histidinol-phosphate transaminase [Aquimonas voraii]SDD20536.1 histidinol phosphate aminotransferase apoenzyme [Aquimonas voraii]